MSNSVTYEGLNPGAAAATVEKLEKLRKRATARGFTGGFEFTTTTRQVTDVVHGFDVSYDVVDVTVTGTPPRYAGWEFLAELDWDPEAGLIVRSAPGAEPVDRCSVTEGRCDHCHKHRRRNATFVVRNTESGEQLQVGSTCIKDFLGWDGKPVFISVNEITTEFEGGGYGFHTPEAWATPDVLAIAWAVIRAEGYRPASWDWSTKDQVKFFLLPPKNLTTGDLSWLEKVRGFAVEATEQAAKVRAFILSDDFSGYSEYVINLKNIAAADRVTLRNVGFLASAPQAYARFQEQTLVRAAEKPSEFVGEIKQRIVLDVTVKAVRFIDSDYGVTTLYTLKDADGNTLKWFSSNQALGDDPDPEKVFKLKGTVKKHDTYNGVKSTQLTRCTVLN